MISYSVHLKIKSNPSFTPCLEKIEISISLWLHTPRIGTGTGMKIIISLCKDISLIGC